MQLWEYIWYKKLLSILHYINFIIHYKRPNPKPNDSFGFPLYMYQRNQKKCKNSNFPFHFSFIPSLEFFFSLQLINLLLHCCNLHLHFACFIKTALSSTALRTSTFFITLIGPKTVLSSQFKGSYQQKNPQPSCFFITLHRNINMGLSFNQNKQKYHSFELQPKQTEIP